MYNRVDEPYFRVIFSRYRANHTQNYFPSH
jgi:hypothetical protein